MADRAINALLGMSSSEDIKSWLADATNVDDLLKVSERVRNAHRTKVKELDAKRQAGEKISDAEVGDLLDLALADCGLAEQVVVEAASPENIAQYTLSRLLPWLKLVAKLALLCLVLVSAGCAGQLRNAVRGYADTVRLEAASIDLLTSRFQCSSLPSEEVASCKLNVEAIRKITSRLEQSSSSFKSKL